MDVKPAWEPIGDQHKHGLPRVVAVQEAQPDQHRLVRWGRIAGIGVWMEMDGYHFHDADTFTHAYIVPAFEPRPA